MFSALKLLYYHTCMFCIVHNSIQEFTIISIIKSIYHDNEFVFQLSNYLNYRTALALMPSIGVPNLKEIEV